MGKAVNSLKHQIDKFDISDKEINYFIQKIIDERIEKILSARERIYLDVFKHKNAQSFENNYQVLKNETLALKTELHEMLDLVLGDK